MSIRKWLVATTLTAGMVFGSVVPATAKDSDKVNFVFGALRTASLESAKAQAEAWLKKVGKFDAAAFNKIWDKEEETILDRTLATLELGSEDAKKILAEARAADRTAPKAVPEILKDTNQDPYFRANLVLGFAKHLSVARVYEEALEALETVKPEQVVDPSSFLFYKAAAEFSLMKKDDATRSIIKLIDDTADAPDRYRMVAASMYIEMASWKDKGLGNIARLMDNVERRLDQARDGEKTQDLQKKIVLRLDELIKEKENQGGGGGGGGNGGSCPDGGSPGQGGDPKGNKSNGPASESKPTGAGSDKGIVDNKTLRKYSDSWGTMPQKERERAIAEMTKDAPPKYRQFVEEYFRQLSKTLPAPE
ncbi:MAG: hypothetical protein N2112_16550 [Gemmataceae bacterium]|jgi:hypothetical protein|nr:hypothetical protein [Gemmataceae bacterium]